MHSKAPLISSMLLFFCAFLLVPARAYAVNSLSFDSISKNGNVGDTIKVGIMINATDAVISADVKITYDMSALEVLTSENGDFFQSISQSLSTPGTLTISALPEGTNGKKGTGTVATANLKLKKSGTSQLKFVCSTTSSTSSKLVVGASTASNAIDCASTGAQVLGISVGTAGAPTPTPVPGSVTPTPVGGGTVVQPGSGQPYTPGGTYTPPTRLPQSGAVEDTIYTMIFGGLFVALGTMLRKYVYN